MIKKLTIKRFKSIRELSISCKRVNLFIGEPDTGKTNILEALNFLSRLGWNWPIDRTFRVHGNTGFNELFHRQFFDKPIEIKLDGFHLRAGVAGQDRHLEVQCSPNGRRFTLGFDMKVHLPELSWVRFYSYTSSAEWQYRTEWPEADKIVVTLVDQDPGAVPPESLQQAKRVQFEGDVELGTLRDHHVLMLHPRLEDCFMKGMRGVGLKSELARTAEELHRVLGTPSAYRHNLFREELRTLRTQAKRKRIPVFLIDLEKIVRRLVTQR